MSETCNSIKLSSDTEDEESVGELEVKYWEDGVATFDVDDVTLLDQSQLNVLMDFIQRQREQFDHPQRHY